MEDAMRLQLRCHGDIDLSQPGMQVEIRSHIARCLRDYPDGGEGVITLAGVEHCFMYVVQNDVVDTVIGPSDYITGGWSTPGVGRNRISRPLGSRFRVAN